MPEPPDTADRIPARNDSDARKRFFRFLNQTVQVVSPRTHWQAAPMPGEQGWTAVTVPDVAAPLKVVTGGQVYLRSTIRFEHCDHPQFSSDRKVRTLFYAHTVTEDAEMSSELYSWQWDPSGWPYPHVHVSGRRAHVPTGRVFLEHIVLFLINDLGIQPACDDWRGKLDANLDRVSRYSSWGGRSAQPLSRGGR